MLNQSGATELLNGTLLPAFLAERERLDRIDKWARFRHDDPYTPRSATQEYKQLRDRAQTPWLTLVVNSVVQGLLVEGYRSSSGDEASPWRYWQANRMDSRQVAIHTDGVRYGLAYATVLPGVDPMTGAPVPSIRGVSPRNMIALYDDPAEDEWPEYALRCDPAKIDGGTGWKARLYDDGAEWLFHVDSGGKATYVEWREHGVGFCPVVRYANMLDTEGRSAGEVEPFIPVAARIDQTVFDRLLVQRFSSWKVRTVTGMAVPDKLEGETEDEYRERTKKRLMVEDILVSESPDSKFGVLEETPLDGFINAKDADIRDLAATSQTPPHYLLGQAANLSAEALTAAEASLSRKQDMVQLSFGESHEQTLRAAAWIDGDVEAASDFEAQIRWRDVGSRSLAQTADALGKMATMLGVPVEMLWEKIPGFTDQDVAKAKELIQSGSSIDTLVNELLANAAPPAV